MIFKPNLTFNAASSYDYRIKDVLMESLAV